VSELPINAVANDVCAALRMHNVVLQAEPGAGKSTGLPLVMLRAGFTGKILMLEPRRLAAQNVAARLASQLGESVGQTIGLRMRGRTSVSKSTKLEVVTEGVLTRILQNDPMLEEVSVVIFDEFHERSLHADLGLTLCLDVQRDVREDLRLLIMSATLNSEGLSEHLGAGVPITCRVRQHPVDIRWQGGDRRTPVHQVVSLATIKACQEHDGDVLVFLPGVAEIEKVASALLGKLPQNTQIHKLHSGVSADAQAKATGTNKGEDRRIILSTSIAETSITIDGVRVVVDSGLERRAIIDGASGIERLETVMASQASATQRAGRAGRTEPGICLRLWSEESHSSRAMSWQPELLRADLSSLLLELWQWGITDISTMPWIDPPPVSAIDRARNKLKRLGLCTDDGLTAYGRSVAALPVEPGVGHMLLWGKAQGTLQLACTLAAIVEDMPRSRSADFTHFLSNPAKHHVLRAQQLKNLVGNGETQGERAEPAVLLLHAYPERLLKRRSGKNTDRDVRYLLSGGSGAVLNSDDPLAQSEYLVASHLGGQGREARIFSALPIDLELINKWCEDLIETHEFVEWDDRSERIVAEAQQRIGVVVLSAKKIQNPDKTKRSAALMNTVKKRGLSCLAITEAVREWQSRVTHMRSLEGDATSYPAIDDKSLLATIDQWLAPYLSDITSLKALRKLDLLPILESMLDYPQSKKLNDWLPYKYKVPSGAEHKLRYSDEGNPVLSVKLQEMFGCSENPTIAGGRINLKVELLSPARRPVQVTEDLGNFWHNSYPEVKKDMAGRYPKHPWPENPLSAEATALTKARLAKK